MSKQTFTPGPWKACLNVPAAAIPGHIIKTDDDAESPIASLWVGGGTHGKPRQLANARLIASAPDLLAALEDCARWLNMLRGQCDRREWLEDHQGANVVYEQARAVLAKAKGEA